MQGIENPNMPPDAEIIMRQWILDKSSITDLVGTRVATRLPLEPTLPFIVITNRGSLLLNPESQAAIGQANFSIMSYAGRWGGDGTKSEPDYNTASNVAQALFKEFFKAGSSIVTTSGGTKSKIYGFTVDSAPTRVEEPELLIANFSQDISMFYRYSE